MAIDPHLAPIPALTRLDWESNHFGLVAAQLASAQLSDEELAATLRLARREGVQFAVWPAASGRLVPPELLTEFGGALVDQKATYKKQLAAAAAEDEPSQQPDPPVCPSNASVASPALIELALISGKHSRFRLDPRIPHERCAAMYRLWIERSVRRELADVVLIAPSDKHESCADDDALGLITISEKAGAANIGLVAVSPAFHGRGIGSALMRAAHRWMRSRRAHESRVVTQLANSPACRLYERLGYQLDTVQPYYHFWL